MLSQSTPSTSRSRPSAVVPAKVLFIFLNIAVFFYLTTLTRAQDATTAFSKQCSIANEVIVELEFDTQAGTFALVPSGNDDASTAEGSGSGQGNRRVDKSEWNLRRRRRLRVEDATATIPTPSQAKNAGLITMPNSAIQLTTTTTTGQFSLSPNLDRTLIFQRNMSNSNSSNSNIKILKARQCPCTFPHSSVPSYCLLSPVSSQHEPNVCGVPRDSSLPIGCYAMSTKTVFIRNTWPVVLLWYGALLIFFIATDNGRNVRDYMLSKICHKRNDRIVSRIITREIEVRDRLLVSLGDDARSSRRRRSGRREEEENDDDEDTVQRITLVLKTKRFVSGRKTKEKDDELQIKGNKVDVNKEKNQLDPLSISASPPSWHAYNTGEEGQLDNTRDQTPTVAGAILHSLGKRDMSYLNSTPETEAESSMGSIGRLESSALSQNNDNSVDNDRKEEDSLELASAGSCSNPVDMEAQHATTMSTHSSSFDADAIVCTLCCHTTTSNEDGNVGGNESNTTWSMESGSIDSNDDKDEVTCTICIMAVKDGDRVGALPCNHIFHVDCLKSWIKQRNVCPLCQEPDIAATRITRSPRTEGNSPASGGESGRAITVNTHHARSGRRVPPGRRPRSRAGNTIIVRRSNNTSSRRRNREDVLMIRESVRARLFHDAVRSETSARFRSGGRRQPSTDNVSSRSSTTSPGSNAGRTGMSHNSSITGQMLAESAEDAAYQPQRQSRHGSGQRNDRNLSQANSDSGHLSA